MSTTLSNFLPEFATELVAALTTAGERELSEQVCGAEVWACSYDPDCGAGYIKVGAGRLLNIVEANVIGSSHGRTIPVLHPLRVRLDTDNFNRLTSIELLNASSLSAKLTAFTRSTLGNGDGVP